MLKKAIAIALTFMITVLVNVAIAAMDEESLEYQELLASEESVLDIGGKNWSASVGIKLWHNNWNLVLSTDSQAVSYNSNTELLMIPILSARYNNWMMSGSFFSKNNYSFGSSMIAFKDGNTLSDISLTAERSEFDINVGYYVLPSLVATLGYKQIDRVFSILEDNQIGDDQKIKTSGFTFGVAAFAPLSKQVGLYGNFAYGYLKTKSEGVNTYNSDYYLGEVGFSYSKNFEGILFVLESGSVYMGYRFQNLVDHYDFYPGTSTLADYTQGFVIGVNLSF